MDASPGTSTPGQNGGALQHVVEALVDQLAAGQVETLYGLHSAAADVRNQGEALRAAAAEMQQARAELATAQAALAEGRAALAETVDALRADVVAQVVAQVQDGVSTLVAGLADAQAALTEGRAALAETVEGLRTDLVTQVVAQVQGQVSALVAAQVDAVVNRVSAVTEALEASSSRWPQLFEEASAAAVERLAGGADAVVRASTETAAAVDEAGRILVDAFAARVASFFSQLQQDLSKREARDTTRERALYERMQKLAEQGEARVKDLTDRLAHETSQLLSRDQELERQRAEAFVGVLETLLTKVGGRRQLRGRVRELVHVERDVPPPTPRTPPPPPPPPPVSLAREPQHPAPAKSTTKKAAPVKKPAATKAAPAKAATKATTKAPAKRAPAAKAAARRKDDA